MVDRGLALVSPGTVLDDGSDLHGFSIIFPLSHTKHGLSRAWTYPFLFLYFFFSFSFLHLSPSVFLCPVSALGTDTAATATLDEKTSITRKSLDRLLRNNGDFSCSWQAESRMELSGPQSEF